MCFLFDFCLDNGVRESELLLCFCAPHHRKRSEQPLALSPAVMNWHITAQSSLSKCAPLVCRRSGDVSLALLRSQQASTSSQNGPEAPNTPFLFVFSSVAGVL